MKIAGAAAQGYASTPPNLPTQTAFCFHKVSKYIDQDPKFFIPYWIKQYRSIFMAPISEQTSFA